MTRQAVTANRWKTRLALKGEVLRSARKTSRYELRALEEGYRVAYYDEFRCYIVWPEAWR